jgi:UPF0716 protein FxsA
MWPLFLFVALPIAEIAAFVIVGGWIGVLGTVGLVLLSAAAGMALLRHQGARTALSLQQAVAGVRNPSIALADGAIVMIAALLLIVPGFLSDAAALALLIPPIRAAVLKAVASRVTVHAAGPRNGARRYGADVIDGEFTEVAPDATPLATPGSPPSGWTRH